VADVGWRPLDRVIAPAEGAIEATTVKVPTVQVPVEVPVQVSVKVKVEVKVEVPRRCP